MNSLVQALSKGTAILSAFGIDELFDNIWMVIGNILWGLCDIFFVILDLFEALFRKLAGVTDTVTTGTGEKIEGDLVLYLIQSELVQQIFMSILVLSLILLIIFTIFAVVKNQYAEKQESPTKIIGNSFKALLMYLMVPIATIVCLMAGNIVLQAIDGATRATTNGGSASDMLFMAAAYNANKLRDVDPSAARENLQYMVEKGWLDDDEEVKRWLEGYGIDFVNNIVPGENILTDQELLEIAEIIDDAFTSSRLGSAGHKWRFSQVNKYYHVTQISLIVVWVGGAFLIWAIGKICWGLVSRLFKMTLYFAISPAVMATFPIQGDKPLGAWRGEMVKNGTMAFCSIGVLNVLYSILPMFDDLKLFGEGFFGNIGSWLANQVLKLFFYIIAFTGAKDLIGTISGWFGTGNALAEGISTKDTVTKQLKRASTKAGGAFTGFKGGIEAGKVKYGDGVKGTVKSLGAGLYGGFVGSGGKDALFGDIDKVKKEISDKRKAGKEAGKDVVTLPAPYWDKDGPWYRKLRLYDKDKHDLNKVDYDEREKAKKAKDKFEKEEGMPLDKVDLNNPRHQRAINRYDSTGNMLKEEEIKEQKRDSDGLKVFKGLSKQKAKADKALADYEDAKTRIIGSAFEGLSEDDKKDLTQAILDGNKQLIETFATKLTDASKQNEFTSLLDRLNDSTISKLNEIKDEYDEAQESLDKAIKDLKEDLKVNDDLAYMAGKYGMVGEQGDFVGLDQLIESQNGQNSILQTAIDKIEENGKELTKEIARINMAHMNNKLDAKEMEKLAKILKQQKDSK